MTDDNKHPWPASWPPFWRAVLHVGIATGVGNLVLVLTGPFIYWFGLDVFFSPSFRSPGFGCPHPATYLSLLTAVLAVVVFCQRHRCLVFVALVLGFLAAHFWPRHMLVPMLQRDSVFGPLAEMLESVLGAVAARPLSAPLRLVPGILAGFVVSGVVLICVRGRSCLGRVVSCVVTGVALFFLAHVWMAMLARLDPPALLLRHAVLCHWYEMSFKMGFPLTYAVTARMLIWAADGGQSAAKE